MAFISMILLRMLISKVSRSTRPTPYITNILKGGDTLEQHILEPILVFGQTNCFNTVIEVQGDLLTR